MDIDAVLAMLSQILIEGAFSFGELIGFMECMNVPGLSNTLANNFSNQSLLHQLIVSNASQEYLLVLAMLNDTDFVKYVAENYSYLVAEAVRKLEGMSVEQYLALVKKHYGDGVLGDLLAALSEDLLFAQKFVLNEHHLYGSSRLGVKTHKRVLLRKEFSISGFEEDGEYIIDETLDSFVYETSKTYFCRMLGFKQYQMTNHLGNIIATVLDRKIGVYDETVDTLMYYTADVVNAKLYYPFGKAMMSYSNPEFSFAYSFNGMERDDETGLTDFGARFYSEDYGRFFSVDPFVNHNFTWSPYVFGLDNPIYFIDHNGEWPGVTFLFFEIEGGAGLGIGVNAVFQAGIAIDNIGRTSFTMAHYFDVESQNLSKDAPEFVTGAAISVKFGFTQDWKSNSFMSATGGGPRSMLSGFELFEGIGGEIGFGDKLFSAKVGFGLGVKITHLSTKVLESVSLSDSETNKIAIGQPWIVSNKVYDKETGMMKGTVKLISDKGKGQIVEVTVYSSAEKQTDSEGNVTYKSSDGRWFSQEYMDKAEEAEKKEKK